MSWILVLIVWTADGQPDGKFLQIESEAACWTRAKQDTPRVRNLYAGKRFKWDCIGPDRAEVAPQKSI